MSEQDTNLMEGEIVAEESAASETTPKPVQQQPKNLPKIHPKQIKDKLLQLKKPKFITVLVVFIALISGFTALIIVASKAPREEIVDPGIFITTPNPTPQIDPGLQEIKDKVGLYSKKVEGLNDSIENYQPPKVDLDVKF